MNIKRLHNSIEELSHYTESGEGINRLAYTKVEQEARNYMMEQFKQEGMEVAIDAAGNVIARRKGLCEGLPAVATGSHIDSVYNAGKYDGVVGVMAALEVIRSLNERHIQTLHPIEVIIFACEESSRFSFSTMGSKAMAGLLKPDEVCSLQDRNGITVTEAFRENSLDFSRVKEAMRLPHQFKSFVELHIEQGPILEKEKLDIGIVSGIAGPTRYRLMIEGKASHSGTTPMNYRHDALLGAAEITLEIERAAKMEGQKGTVGTVGVLNIQPGGMNIVPGEVHMDIDIRGIDADSKQVVIDALNSSVKRVEKERELRITTTLLANEQPVDMDNSIVSDLESICKEKNISYKVMPSGAGHDAMNMAALCPTGMIFIPSKEGLSHNPEEFTSIEQIEIGTILLEEHILKSAINGNATKDQPTSMHG